MIGQTGGDRRRGALRRRIRSDRDDRAPGREEAGHTLSTIPPAGDGGRLFPLAPHPDTPCAAVERLTARATRTGDGRLALEFVLTGRLSDLDFPPPGPPARATGLWQHTCFEAFIARDVAGEPAYHEFNLSPARQWDLHAFRSRRDGGPLDGDPPAPRITLRREATRFTLTAMLDLASLDPRLRAASLRLGFAAVVEDAWGALSCWALRHPANRPDFHDPANFVLRLPLASRTLPPYPPPP